MNKIKQKASMLIACTLLFGALLSACGTGAEQPPAEPPGIGDNSGEEQPDNNTPETPDADPDAVPKFEQELNNAKDAAGAIGAMDQHMKGATPEQADEMFVLLEKFYETDLSSAEQLLMDPAAQQALLEIELPMTGQKAAELKDEKLRTAVQGLLAGKYKLETAEGSVFPVVDYKALAEAYQSYFTDAIKDYIALKAADSEQPVARDAALAITADELAARALAAENYLAKYPDSVRFDTVKIDYLHKLTMVLFGLNNTPTFDYNDYRLTGEAKANLEKIVAEHPDTVTSGFVQEFLDIVKQSNGQVYVKKDGQQTDAPEMKSFKDSMRETVEKRIAEKK
ncbi:hypothetical protein PAE9249_03790 [Paenibacillus sp. CECT 9249]|uniref:hypothetical protein n=1 Tax=Paenibacillus sp. CECT 9249 TaxID=2845385 RepID=UPI001E58E375|nr:hypothetical protein [Paenibacillus sp. CECT 9249]CAH0121263.1 hypothetical protein PAE9249_03790 [Paenibacillus sp. CECT 9249]